MKVRRLHMTSFRGFRDLSLEFTGPVTVLVGINGAGKTSVLECLSGLLFEIPLRILSYKQARRISDYSNIQNGVPYTRNTVEVELDGTFVKWSTGLARKGYRPPKALSDLTELRDALAGPGWDLINNRGRLPLAMYYSVARTPSASIQPNIKHKKQSTYTIDQTFDHLRTLLATWDDGSGDFHTFFDWFREREDLENEQRLQLDAEYRDSQLEAVRRAITRLVPGFSNLRVQRSPLRMIVQKAGQTLEIDQLSGGEKSLLTMAGDIGRRLAIANPGLQDPLSAEAVVMIDEIELHLHPGWQRMVVERLRQAFPNCQFILTTHSPQVLSQIPAESVILLDHFQRADLAANTQGRDSNSILAEVMGVPEWPPATAESIHAISQMIDREELPQARDALDVLARQLGAHDSEVVRLRSLIEFLGI